MLHYEAHEADYIPTDLSELELGCSITKRMKQTIYLLTCLSSS